MSAEEILSAFIVLLKRFKTQHLLKRAEFDSPFTIPSSEQSLSSYQQLLKTAEILEANKCIYALSKIAFMLVKTHPLRIGPLQLKKLLLPEDEMLALHTSNLLVEKIDLLQRYAPDTMHRLAKHSDYQSYVCHKVKELQYVTHTVGEYLSALSNIFRADGTTITGKNDASYHASEAAAEFLMIYSTYVKPSTKICPCQSSHQATCIPQRPSRSLNKST